MSDSTSSIGPSWPPEATTHNRLRGFYDGLVTTDVDVGTFVDDYRHYQRQVEADEQLDRLSFRLVADIRTLPILESMGVTLEAALPIRDDEQHVVAYVGWNDTDRTPDQAKFDQHARVLEEVVSGDNDREDVVEKLAAQNFVPKTISASTPDADKKQMTERFTDLYSAFGYSPADVETLLFNPNNTIAYIDDGNQVVSTAMAEMATVRVEGYGHIRMAEITEAFTLPSHRQRGLYHSISGFLTEDLVGDVHNPQDIIYGESNLAVRGVLIAGHKNGRWFSYFDRDRLGVRQPNFGILPQSFSINDGSETRRYNDFAISYVPLDQ